MNYEEFNTLIKSRRSVFQNQYTNEKVDDSIVKQMLENANWAPNHKLTEPWRFIVYTGSSLATLAKLQAEYYKEYTTADNSFKEERYLNLLNKPKLSSHIVVVGMNRDEKKSVPEIEEVGAVFCAIQNMYLTATAYHIGCYLSTGGITYFEGAQKSFGWSESVKLIGFMHIGVPKETKQIGQRKSVSEKTVWNS